MQQHLETDYIIVGQGLAGTILAQTFLKAGKPFIIIDEPTLSKASKIAAGLYNPVVFKRLVKSWMADELVPFMDNFYTDCETILNAQFYFKKEIVRLFAEEQEKELWLKKTTEPVGNYLSKNIEYDFLNNIVFNPLGSANVLNAGNLDTKTFLNSFKSHFKKLNILFNEVFDYNALTISDSKIEYKNITAKKIIFCDGYKTTTNPYFSWLPFKLTKGETITIQIDKSIETNFDKVVNKGVFILPIGNNQFKIGATYEWENLDENTTTKGKAELEEKLKKVLKTPYEIIDHQAGIRPTVNDRRPLIGLHPKHPALAIFNGLGTKGVMLAPYFAQHFFEHLENGKALEKEIDIKRFNKFYL